jgi:hypothetical protein
VQSRRGVTVAFQTEPTAPEAAVPVAAAMRRRDRLLAAFASTYLTADARSLAAGRIALALVLLLDLGKRWGQLESWYTNDGLVPNHTLLWQPAFKHDLSLFFLASHGYEAAVGFGVCALAYCALLVGVRTRLAQVASLVCVLSLHGRVLLYDNGGDVALGLLCVWTAFLPTGRFWSVDAVLARRRGEAQPRTAVVSLAALALLCQLALIYFFNAVHKGGATWREGTAVHYVLHLDRLVTPFGVWLREGLSPTAARVMTWSTLVMEWSLPILLLAPFAVRRSRRAALAVVVALHAGIGLCMNLGIFVPAMMVFALHLLHGDDWDALARWWPRSARRARLAETLTARARALTLRAARLLTAGHTLRVGEPGPVVRTLVQVRPVARELAVGLLIVIATNQLFAENRAAQRVIAHQNSPQVAAAVTYLNLFQGWSMFAPNVSTTDTNLAVDAVTVDGRHVDPWNEAANPRTPMPGASIPAGMGPNWLFYQYVTRFTAYPAYQTAFREWLLRYPKRTGRKGDELVSYKVFLVEDESPPPGEREPRNARASLLLQWP